MCLCKESGCIELPLRVVFKEMLLYLPPRHPLFPVLDHVFYSKYPLRSLRHHLDLNIHGRLVTAIFNYRQFPSMILIISSAALASSTSSLTYTHL